MVEPQLLAAAFVTLTVASAYAYVAQRLTLRAASTGEARRALTAFAFWWNATAVNIAVAAVIYLAASFGYTSFPVQLAYAYLQRILVASALVGLMYYLSVALVGRGFIRFWIGFYTFAYVMLMYALAAAQPDGVYVGHWRTDVTTADVAPAWVSLVNLATIVLPPVAGAIGYFTLVFRLREKRDALKRFRIVVVSVSLTAWWIVAVLAGQRASLANEDLQVVNRFLGLLVAVAILIAYEPPALLRRWLTRHQDGDAITPPSS